MCTIESRVSVLKLQGLSRCSLLSPVHRGHPIIWHWLYLLTHSRILERLVSEIVQLCSPSSLQLDDLNLSDGWRVQLIHHSTPTPLMTFRRIKVEPRPLFRRAMQIPTNFLVPVGECGSGQVTAR